MWQLLDLRRSVSPQHLLLELQLKQQLRLLLGQCLPLSQLSRLLLSDWLRLLLERPLQLPLLQPCCWLLLLRPVPADFCSSHAAARRGLRQRAAPA